MLWLPVQNLPRFICAADEDGGSPGRLSVSTTLIDLTVIRSTALITSFTEKPETFAQLAMLAILF